MGSLNKIFNMLKFAFVVCCAALAAGEPEAKADAYLYGAYGYGAYPYGGYTYGAYGAYGYGAYPYGGYAYGAYPYTYGAYYGKRSADAEPKADADAYLYGAYGYGAYPY